MEKKTDGEVIFIIVCSYFKSADKGWDLFRLDSLQDFIASVVIFFLSLSLCEDMRGEEFFWGFFILYTILFSFYLFLLGFPYFYREVKQRSLLEKTTIKNYKGEVPKIKSIKKNIDNSISINLDLLGTDPELFERKKKIIETTYGLNYYGLEDSDNPRYKKLLLTPLTLPKEFKFKDALKEKPRPYHVVIGMGIKKPLVTDISSWPHGLIAGSTGSGKSVQLKSIIAQFIHATPNSQLVLCDLKGGVEFSAFEGIKNVKIYSELSNIVCVLENIVDEMEERFKFMKEKKIQSIDPHKHNKCFIFIVIDESSLLYRKPLRSDDHYDAIAQARTATQKILKLGRAAKISVLFGLQRPSKESIDTEIQENIDARMCFKINTVEGSIRMLGHKNAVDLPPIAGRGIWKLGNTEELYQAPFITNKDIEELKKSQSEITSDDFIDFSSTEKENDPQKDRIESKEKGNEKTIP